MEIYSLLFSLALTIGTPTLTLDSTQLDMGRVVADSVVEKGIGFSNTGDAPLVIYNIFSECGCTVPSYPRDTIAPGGRGEIRIRFDSRKRRKGSFRKALRIRSNASNPRELLIIKGKITGKDLE